MKTLQDLFEVIKEIEVPEGQALQILFAFRREGESKNSLVPLRLKGEVDGNVYSRTGFLPMRYFGLDHGKILVTLNRSTPGYHELTDGDDPWTVRSWYYVISPEGVTEHHNGDDWRSLVIYNDNVVRERLPEVLVIMEETR